MSEPQTTADHDPTRFWGELGKTDPERTKKFNRPGGFQGTDINPQYRWQKLTEQFGPAGVAWGSCDEHIWTQPLEDGQVMVFVRLRLWYEDPATGSQGATPFGCGGDFIVKKGRQGLMADDEGYKKAYTDALGNAARFLGLGADVYMGLFDDSKYVNQRQAEETAKNGGGHANGNGGESPSEQATKDIIQQLDAATDSADIDAARQKASEHWVAMTHEQAQRVTDAAKAAQQRIAA